MTHAVCFNCGAMKFGALVHCRACGAAPRTDLDFAYSFGFSDHLMEYDVLVRISSSMLAGAPRPVFDAEDERKLIEMFGPESRKAQRAAEARAADHFRNDGPSDG